MDSVGQIKIVNIIINIYYLLYMLHKFTSFFSGKTTTMGNERTLDNVGIHLLKAEKLKTSFIQGFKD